MEAPPADKEEDSACQLKQNASTDGLNEPQGEWAVKTGGHDQSGDFLARVGEKYQAKNRPVFWSLVRRSGKLAAAPSHEYNPPIISGIDSSNQEYLRTSGGRPPI